MVAGVNKAAATPEMILQPGHVVPFRVSPNASYTVARYDNSRNPKDGLLSKASRQVISLSLLISSS